MEIITGTTEEVNDSQFDRGWVVGHMHNGLRGTKDLEIKAWRYEGEIDYPRKTFLGTELIVVYGGAIMLHLEQNDAIEHRRVSAFEWVLLGPNITKKVEVVESPTYGVCVRWPSQPGLNVLMD